MEALKEAFTAASVGIYIAFTEIFFTKAPMKMKACVELNLLSRKLSRKISRDQICFHARFRGSFPYGEISSTEALTNTKLLPQNLSRTHS